MSEDDPAKTAWLRDVLGLDLGAARDGQAGAPGRDAVAGTTRKRLTQWKAARARAMTSLVALERSISRLTGPDAVQAVILLRAVRANLTPEPTTAQQIAELRRYLEQDDVISDAEMPNNFGIMVSLRAPLLRALAGLDEGA